MKTRPSMLTLGFRERIKLTIENIMGQGGTITEVCKELVISRQSLNRWEHEDQEISDILERGRLLRDSWWIKKGRDNMENPKFKFDGYKWMTMNIINWRNKDNVEASVGVTNTVQDAARKRSKVTKEETKNNEKGIANEKSKP